MGAYHLISISPSTKIVVWQCETSTNVLKFSFDTCMIYDHIFMNVYRRTMRVLDLLWKLVVSQMVWTAAYRFLHCSMMDL